MSTTEQLIKQLINLDYTYEHVPFGGIEEKAIPSARTTGYILFKEEEILPILRKLEESLNGS